MKDIVARCGFRCNLCLAYRDNIKSKKDQKRFRNGLLKYYGYQLTIEECYCDGCMTDDSENPRLLTFDCKIRACVIKRGLENCAHCDQYPCKDLKSKFTIYEEIAKHFGAAVPEEDYNRFIKPYESKKVLDKIRKKEG